MIDKSKLPSRHVSLVQKFHTDLLLSKVWREWINQPFVKYCWNEQHHVIFHYLDKHCKKDGVKKNKGHLGNLQQ